MLKVGVLEECDRLMMGSQVLQYQREG